MDHLVLTLAAAGLLWPALWALFWLERQGEARKTRITRIAWWLIIGMMVVTAVAVAASFVIDPDPLCRRLPEGWEKNGWPCGVAVHNLRGR